MPTRWDVLGFLLAMLSFALYLLLSPRAHQIEAFLR